MPKSCASVMSSKTRESWNVIYNIELQLEMVKSVSCVWVWVWVWESIEMQIIVEYFVLFIGKKSRSVITYYQDWRENQKSLPFQYMHKEWIAEKRVH